ncbi:MAG: hypothetical protein EOM16_06125 [Bacteroidia bacterium]|jgi:predicted Fe-Mo cluster-binding NifX family protein|nr:NifB/NifX family molybdenum-iron cluster-binding protein [Bacteroidales bacterium]MDD3299403.1 NifB/NifX family molybdenum-iron cluster-binding protein [Bacteroidales bacterium]MDD3843383.1 NifB/NifX family molybdenum-iron cluster-binding protein [Bacteroidales bacterium]MDD4617695.1 NifB/NifX family molybdenum-iron cluster-binding protein [Bacteroidales bacterium]NCC46595.1 hypothetical protein [Bacteroidia bacterium]
MKYAITAKRDNINSHCDIHFARASFFAIYDNQSKEIKFIENEFRNIPERAGPSVVKFLSSLKTNVIVSTEFGEKIKNILDSEKIGMVIINDNKTTIKKIIEIIENKKE